MWASVKVRTALVSVLTVGLLGWFLRNANFADVWLQVRRARMDLVLVALACVGATYWIRVVRWQYLLAPIGATTFRTAFRATVIGFAALSVLPARVGDVLRPYLLARKEGLSASATFATVVMERVLDLFAVLALLALYVYGFADNSTLPPQLLRPVEFAAAGAGASAAVLMALMWVLASHPERIGTLVFSAARVLPSRVAAALSRTASAFSTGLAVARKPKGLVIAVFWSLALWVVLATEVWVVSLAFGIAMPFAGSFLLQALLVIGVAVPTPGGVGSFHEAYRFGATTFFHIANDRAVAAAIVLHAISFMPVVLLGMVFMAQDGLSVGGLQRLARSTRPNDEKETAHTDEVPILRTSGR